VLDWLQSLGEVESNHPVLRSGGAPWPEASYELLSRKIKPVHEVNLVGRALFGGSGEEEDKARTWLLDLLNSGCAVTLHLREGLVLDRKKMSLEHRKTLSFLAPYAANGKLSLTKLPDEDFGAPENRLLRLFTRPREGAMMWFSDYQAAPLLETVLPQPAYTLTANNHWATVLGALIGSATPILPAIFKESGEVNRWELHPGSKRNIPLYFASILNAYVEDLVMRDPYCGCGS